MTNAKDRLARSIDHMAIYSRTQETNKTQPRYTLDSIMRRNYPKNSYKLVLDTKPIMLSLIPKLELIFKSGIDSKMLMECVVKAWRWVDSSYIDLYVNGVVTPSHAIANEVTERFFDGHTTFTRQEALLFEAICEVCLELYPEVGCLLENLFTETKQIKNITIDRWLANDLVLEIEYEL